MSFRCDPATLARLEWPRLAECLAACAATHRGAEACRGELFEATAAGARERLKETDEARALLDSEEDLPFGGIEDIRTVLELIRRGGSPATADFARLRNTLEAAERIRTFLASRRERVPGLSAFADTLPDTRELVSRINSVITPEGEIAEGASPELKKLSRKIRELEREIDQRMAGFLRDPNVLTHLQDSYATLRENRPVLPVKAEARRRIRGIVHDVSSSGTTVFIEPEAVVEAGNRLRLAQTGREREIERLLRELGDKVRARHEEITAAGSTIEVLDVAMSRGRLSLRLDARAPRVGEDENIDLRQLRHPLLELEAGLAPEDVVPNDMGFPEDARGLVISGPNAGGKTVSAKALGLAVLSLRAGMHVPCSEQSSLPILDAVYADIGDEQDLRAGLSTFSARMSNLARIVSDAGSGSLVIVDEVGDGTEPGEGAALAQAILESLVDRGAYVVATTHFNRLKELAGSDPRFVNASAEFNPETLLPTYRIHLGAPGSSGAMWVAQRMGLDDAVVEKARDLLDREDSKLEALTRGLSELRQELEAERHMAQEVREQSEAVRETYEARLTSLRDAREQALAAMKTDLEAAYKNAQSEIADVVRDLQRERPSEPATRRAAGQAATLAQMSLADIRERTAQVEKVHAEPQSAGKEPTPELLSIGVRVELVGLPGEAVVLEAPDKRNRLAVRVGGARMNIALERVAKVLGPVRARTGKKSESHSVTRVERAPEEPLSGSTLECDLRGLRVDEALERAEAHLARGLGHSENRLRLIHGHGTGALRDAIRSWLRNVPEAVEFGPGGPREGGNGVTIVVLER
ncbi:MAG: hypothetical protein GY725_04065 [bacterium]|nr:hypothetical protein [bacterium]